MTQRILITGGSSGLGLALAKVLAVRGDVLGLLARDPRKLESAATEIRAAVPGAKVFTAAADVQDDAGLPAVFEALVEAMGGLDVLINSAGILQEGRFMELPMAAHREMMGINYFGTLNAIRAALPRLQHSSQPRIVNIASIAGLTGCYGYSAYCASKHALVGLTDSLHYELAPRGIIVQLICPGEFESPMVDALDLNRTPENRAQAQMIPRVGVEVIVDAVLRGMEGTEFQIVPGALAKLSAFGLRHFPAVTRLVSDARIRGVRPR